MAVFGKMLRSLEGGGAVGEPGTVWLLGDGRYAVDAVGESNYQEALEQVAGGRQSKGVDKIVTAELRLENDNPYDSKAVAVFVDGLKVGYLARALARDFRAQAGDQLESARRILCRGKIRGGWERGPRDRGHFGIVLDIGAGGDQTA